MTIRTYLTENEKQLVFLALPVYAEKHEETMLSVWDLIRLLGSTKVSSGILFSDDPEYEWAGDTGKWWTRYIDFVSKPFIFHTDCDTYVAFACITAGEDCDGNYISSIYADIKTIKVEDTAEKDLITACIDMIIWISDHMAKENYKIEFDKTKW